MALNTSAASSRQEQAAVQVWTSRHEEVDMQELIVSTGPSVEDDDCWEDVSSWQAPSDNKLHLRRRRARATHAAVRDLAALNIQIGHLRQRAKLSAIVWHDSSDAEVYKSLGSDPIFLSQLK